MGNFRFNTNDLRVKIRREILSSLPERKRLALSDVGHFLRSEVQKRTPVDEGFLTSGIAFDLCSYRRSMAVAVYIPVNDTSASYAIKMHESSYKLGKNSLAKQAKVGVLVGRKFITRSLDDNRGKIVKIIQRRLEI